MPSGPRKRRAAKNKMATLEVVLRDTVDSFNAEESKLENLGNLNSGNQEDGILYGNDLGSVVPEKKETLPAEQELSVRNEKPPKQDPIFISESAPMVSADLAEVLPSPMNDESHQMSADSSGPITATDLNALPPKRCKAEAKEVLPKTAISSYELDQTIPLVKLQNWRIEAHQFSVVSEKKETLPAVQELSVRNEKPPKQDPIFISESAPMVSADLAEVLPSPMNDESHQMSADSSGPITATDLNALPPKRCKAEAKEVLPKTAISSYELDQTIPQLLTIKARVDNLKVCLDAAVQLSDKLNDALMELLK